MRRFLFLKSSFFFCEREEIKPENSTGKKLTFFSLLLLLSTPRPRQIDNTDATARLKDNTPELDYMTHVVVRMYERARVPVSSPDRFRVEVLFSPGASVDPVSCPPAGGDHTLPVCPRWHLERDGGITLEEAEAALGPFSTAAASSLSGGGGGGAGGAGGLLGGVSSGFYGAGSGNSSRRWGDRSLSASGTGGTVYGTGASAAAAAAAACFAPSALGAKPAAAAAVSGGTSSPSTFAFSPTASPLPSPAAPARKKRVDS